MLIVTDWLGMQTVRGHERVIVIVRAMVRVHVRVIVIIREGLL